jgi:endoglucanase
MDPDQVDLLKRLTESFGPSGFERETASVVKEEMEGVADSCRVNKLGSVLFERRGTSDAPKVLVAAHIDEVGFCVTGIDDTGFLSFTPLGGWFDQVLLGQRVTVRTRNYDLEGVIAATPPHLLSEEKRKKVVKQEDMYIDIGTSSRKESEDLGVRTGDPVTPKSDLSLIHRGKIAMGKAFDDRIGTFVAMEAVKRLKAEKVSHPNTVIGAATTQEEIGARGARTVAHDVEPDVCLVVEADVSGDVPGCSDKTAPAKMGNGAAILTYDRSMVPNQPLKDFVISAAEEEKIPHQLSIITKGGTDAGAIHVSGSGCPSLVIGVPTRHIHSHVGLLSLADVDAVCRLVIACITRLDRDTVDSFTAL